MYVWLPFLQPMMEPWPATQACVLTRNRTGDLWVHMPVLNPLRHTSQGHPFISLENFHLPSTTLLRCCLQEAINHSQGHFIN